MINYVCTQCGNRYSPEETIQHYDYLHGDLYVICPGCRSECRKEYEEDDEEEDADENEEEEEV